MGEPKGCDPSTLSSAARSAGADVAACSVGSTCGGAEDVEADPAERPSYVEAGLAEKALYHDSISKSGEPEDCNLSSAALLAGTGAAAGVWSAGDVQVEPSGAEGERSEGPLSYGVRRLTRIVPCGCMCRLSAIEQRRRTLHSNLCIRTDVASASSERGRRLWCV